MSIIEINHTVLPDFAQSDNKMRETLLLKEIDQLENAVNSFSKSTNWIKQACVPISTALATLLTQKIFSPDGVAIIILILIIFSWLLDSYCFYFQRNLRVKMEKNFCLLYPKWLDGKTPCKSVTRRQALLNKSNFLYFFLLGIVFLFLLRSF